MNRRKKSDAPRNFTWKRSLGVLMLLGFVALLAFGMLFRDDRSTGVQASANPAPTPKNQKKYIATKPIVVDKQSGQPRMPTVEETEELVSDLSELTKRPEDLPQTTSQSGGISIDLEGGYAGVMLARPKSDGTFETRCVFTFEEGADFLGLVEAPIE